MTARLQTCPQKQTINNAKIMNEPEIDYSIAKSYCKSRIIKMRKSAVMENEIEFLTRHAVR